MKASDLKPILPFLSIAVIIIGLIKHMILYGYFNIQITNFITASEILLLFADDIILILGIFILPFLISFFFMSDTVGVRNYQNFQELAKLPTKKRFLSFGYIVDMMFVAFAVIMIWIKRDYLATLAFSAMILSISFAIIVPEFKIKYDKIYNEPLSITYHNLIITMFFVVAGILVSCCIQIMKIEGGKYIGTIIETEKKTYLSDSTFFYIGKTDSYTFMYNKKQNTSTVIPNGEITKMVIKVNKKSSTKKTDTTNYK